MLAKEDEKEEGMWLPQVLAGPLMFGWPIAVLSPEATAGRVAGAHSLIRYFWALPAGNALVVPWSFSGLIAYSTACFGAARPPRSLANKRWS